MRTARRPATDRLRGALALVVVAAAVACSAPPEDAAAPTATATMAPSSAAPAAGTAPGTTAGTTAGARPPGADRTDQRLALVGRDSAFPGLGTPWVDVAHYDLDLALAPSAEREQLRATATVDARARADLGGAAHPTIDLDAGPFTVEAVEVDGRPATRWEHATGKLRVTPGEVVPAGATFRLSIRYGGTPVAIPTTALPGTAVGWQDGAEGSMVLSEPEGAHGWFPANDTVLDKATYTIAVTVPEPMAAVASGRLDGIDEVDGGRRFRWTMDRPMASYLATVVAGELVERAGDTVDGVDYDYWHDRHIPLAPSLLRTPDAVDALAERLGPFPFATYGAIEYPSTFLPGDPASALLARVAFESQGRSLFARGTADESTVIHEAAHQWLGDSVSVTDWGRDLWWVEGFAHFAEVAVTEERRAAEPDAFARERAACRGVDATVIPAPELFAVPSYQCGALVFHALYVELGAPRFWQGLRTFTERYAYANASTDDLVAVLSEVAERDLRTFVASWLSGERPERP